MTGAADGRAVVVDASVLAALLTLLGDDGDWAVDSLRGRVWLAPSLATYEVANVLRRLRASGVLPAAAAYSAHVRLLSLPLRTYPYPMVASRVWELSDNLTAYDASYVAVAELAGVELLTLDRRLARAPGPRCSVRTPDA